MEHKVVNRHFGTRSLEGADGELITTEPEKKISLGGAAKAVIEGDMMTVSGYLVKFTDQNRPDLYGEWFNADTNFGGLPQVGSPVFYNHGLHKDIGHKLMGSVVKSDIRADGIYIEADVALDEPYKRRVAEWVAKYDMGWSSGAFPSSVDIREDGFISSWVPAEASLTRHPAMPFDTQAKLMSVKSFAEALKESEGDDDPIGADSESDTNTENVFDSLITQKGTTNMTSEQILAFVKSFLETVTSSEGVPDLDESAQKSIESGLVTIAATQGDALTEDNIHDVLAPHIKNLVSMEIRTQKAAEEKRAAKAAAIAASIADEVRTQRDVSPKFVQDASPAPAPPLEASKSVNIEVSEPQAYSHWDSDTMSLYATIASGNGKIQNAAIPVDRAFLRSWADKRDKEAVKAQSGDTNYAPITPEQYAAIKSIKSDEVEHTGNTGYGAEWISTAWEQNIWAQDRVAARVRASIRTQPMTTASLTLPLEGADPTMHFVPETEDEAQLALTSANPLVKSRVGTGNVTLTAKKFAIQIPISSEFNEDSVSGSMPFIMQQTRTAWDEQTDFVLLNGDTSAANNINLDGGTPAATDNYMAFDGLIHNALVTNSANAVDFSTAPTFTNLLSLRFKLAPRNNNTNRLVMVTDFYTYEQLLKLDEVRTVDKFGPMATVLTGQVASIGNVPILVTDQMNLAATNGKVSSTGGNNVKGRILLYNRDRMVFGARRNVRTVFSEIPHNESYMLTATARFDLAFAGADAVALAYNVSVSS